MLNPIEEKILRKLSERHLLTKRELTESLSDNGSRSAAIEMALSGLTEKQFLAKISPIGSTCYVLTKKGSKLLEDRS